MDSWTYENSYLMQVDDIVVADNSVSPVNTPPVAANDADNTMINSPVTTNVLANDSDPDNDPLILYSLSRPAHGTAINNGNGTITYTPAQGFIGEDAYVYTISDGRGAYFIVSPFRRKWSPQSG